ncbi:MAG: hypothetical protein M3680_02820 [Myxococcota bacterium]|nr:hypothetical protein [Myxococcota bacterium]
MCLGLTSAIGIDPIRGATWFVMRARSSDAVTFVRFASHVVANWRTVSTGDAPVAVRASMAFCAAVT